MKYTWTFFYILSVWGLKVNPKRLAREMLATNAIFNQIPNSREESNNICVTSEKILISLDRIAVSPNNEKYDIMDIKTAEIVNKLHKLITDQLLFSIPKGIVKAHVAIKLMFQHELIIDCKSLEKHSMTLNDILNIVKKFQGVSSASRDLVLDNPEQKKKQITRKLSNYMKVRKYDSKETTNDYKGKVFNDPKYTSVESVFKEMRIIEAFDYMIENKLTSKSGNVIVGIVDDGIVEEHDIHWFHNNLESNNGKDDDDNGCIDDEWGCDCTNEVLTGAVSPISTVTHGTALSQMISERGNNEWEHAGLSVGAENLWVTSLYVGAHNIKLSSITKCLDYAEQLGVKVTVNSYASTMNNKDKIDMANEMRFQSHIFNVLAERGHIFLSSVGNYKINMDANKFDYSVFPCMAKNINSVLCIMGGLDIGTEYSLSSSGHKSVDLVASVTAFNGENGVSFATPKVAAIVALTWRAYPFLNSRDILTSVRRGVDKDSKVMWSNKALYGWADALGSLKLASEFESRRLKNKDYDTETSKKKDSNNKSETISGLYKKLAGGKFITTNERDSTPRSESTQSVKPGDMVAELIAQGDTKRNQFKSSPPHEPTTAEKYLALIITSGVLLFLIGVVICIALCIRKYIAIGKPPGEVNKVAIPTSSSLSGSPDKLINLEELKENENNLDISKSNQEN